MSWFKLQSIGTEIDSEDLLNYSKAVNDFLCQVVTGLEESGEGLSLQNSEPFGLFLILQFQNALIEAARGGMERAA